MGLLLKDDAIVVGDVVEIEPRNNEEWVITKVLPRKNIIARQLTRDKSKKIIATNVDLLVIMASMENPPFKRGLIDRYLLRAADWEVPAIFVLNKIDIMDHATDWAFECSRIQPLCSQIYAISAKNPEKRTSLVPHSYDDLFQDLKGKTVIFLGQSGVGKSKLIQALSNESIQIKSQAIGKVGKGVHTTTWAELHVLSTFSIIDSPGIRSLSLSDIPAENLIHCMPDLFQLTSQCQFHNCQHNSHSKGCIFWEGENFSSKLSPEIISRFQSYQRFMEEIETGKDWDKN